MDIEKVSKLARLELNEEEKQKFSKQFENIMKWIDELNEINTDGIEPIFSITGMENNLRKDSEEFFGNRERIIKNFPNREYDFAKVKKVIE
ncbi:MAG TPA: Asp-tRNA(Asn)/Glu-tRNA(Gln) amidotransferase subunit GatC [Elusimicrobiales bacterium]|nr:Asp-tRNA(Asn)/Glu-tRNA(Gln) amidotransferase subunit GatC [Elusimicrobiales bacterium]